ncbi:hypothetical protein [Arthrobacter sp. HLT1-20]
MTTDPRIEAAIAGLDQADLHATKNGTPLSEYLEALATAALAAADTVDPLRQPGHRVEIAQFSWTLQHPAECRPNLLDCPITRTLHRLGVSGIDDGTYVVELTADGSLFFPDAVTL